MPRQDRPGDCLDHPQEDPRPGRGPAEDRPDDVRDADGRCPGCGALSSPGTDAIPGTSLGPRLRATIQAYERAHSTEQDMRLMLAEIEGVRLSTGTISGCITAMAGHIDGAVLSVPDEEPVMLDPSDLRGHRCPAAPRRDVPDTGYHRQDAILTRRSNLWTSFGSQPAITRIVERAPIDPWVLADETGHRAGPDGAQASAAETVHTTQVRVIPRRDAPALRYIRGWMEDRPAMRDDTTGYEWRSGILSRCNIHLLRYAVESSMEHDPGSSPPVHLQGRRGAQGRAGGIGGARLSPAASPV